MSRGPQPFLHLRLIVKHWDERLLKYAVALRRLLTEITQFEPGVQDWLMSITWQYDVGDQCPYPDMPDPASWTSPRAQTALPQAAPQAVPQEAPPRDELQETWRVCMPCGMQTWPRRRPPPELRQKQKDPRPPSSPT